MPGKNYSGYLAFIDSIKKGDRSIIFGLDYVVLSKKAYETLIDYHHPEIKSSSFDEPFMHDWIKQKFLEQDRDR